MLFRYRKLNLTSPFSNRKYLLRPIIPVSLTYKKCSIRYEALIDSGADFCIFPIEIAQKLNIRLDKKQSIYFSGLGKEVIRGYKSNIIITIGEIDCKTKIVFADMANKSGILGQNGFFDLFKVKFDLEQEEIEVLKTENQYN